MARLGPARAGPARAGRGGGARRRLRGRVRRCPAHGAEGSADLPPAAALAGGAERSRRPAEGDHPRPPSLRGRAVAGTARRHPAGRGAAALAAPLPRGGEGHAGHPALHSQLRGAPRRLARLSRAVGRGARPRLAGAARSRGRVDRRLPRVRPAAPDLRGGPGRGSRACPVGRRDADGAGLPRPGRRPGGPRPARRGPGGARRRRRPDGVRRASRPGPDHDRAEPDRRDLRDGGKHPRRDREGAGGGGGFSRLRWPPRGPRRPPRRPRPSPRGPRPRPRGTSLPPRRRRERRASGTPPTCKPTSRRSRCSARSCSVRRPGGSRRRCAPRSTGFTASAADFPARAGGGADPRRQPPLVAGRPR